MILNNFRRFGALVVCVALMSVLAGCFTVRLVSPYDQVIDTGLKEYRQKMTASIPN